MGTHAALGALAWLALVVMGRFHELGEALVALAIAVVVPLGAGLSELRGERVAASPWVRVLRMWLPFGMALGLAAFALPVGPLGGLCAAGWLIATVLAALSAVARVARRGLSPHEELAIDVGHAYLPIGGVWLVASRGGAPLLGFHEPIVLYTANHFHFAGFAAPVVVGLLGRELGLRRARGAPTAKLASPGIARVHRVATAFVLAGVPLVAAGIVVSHALELPAAILLGLAMLAVAGLSVAAARGRVARGAVGSGALLGASGLALVVSMGFAIVFASTGSATRGSAAPLIPYATMAAVHGVANACGFALLGLVAYEMEPPPARSGPYGGTWPRLFGRGFIGVDFFDRMGAVDPSREVKGQVASLAAFAHAGFHPERADAEVRELYESTAAFELFATPTWHPPFRLGGRAFAWLARRALGQLVLPTAPEDGEAITTRLFAVRDDLDGRSDVRGYVRAYRDGAGERANYVGAYSTHASGDRRLLSCAFPLPFAALAGVLRFDDGDAPGWLTLSSRPPEGEGPSDEGMFLVTRVGPLRLPIDERLDVGPGPSGALVATHAVRVLGLRAFTLRYTLARRR